TVINRHEINIITVEDPVEYRLGGVNQVQINAKAGLTFATASRSILRSDPDVVMVGEIRDGETAEISIEADLAGNLVLSTLHANPVGRRPREGRGRPHLDRRTGSRLHLAARSGPLRGPG